MTISSSELQDIVSVVSDVARGAGKLLRARFESGRSGEGVCFKDDASPVTDADLEAHGYIEKRLRERYPAFGFVSEESPRDDNVGEYGDCYFVVDPLDGTKNFLDGIPFFDVSIALYARNQPLVGVVYDPIHDALYSASANGGAKCCGRDLSVRQCSRFEDADMDINCTKLPESQFTAVYHKIARRCRKVRYFGNAALEVCWVASGCLDAVVNHYLSIWDMGACGLILEEAGGIWSTLDGSKPDVSQMAKFPIVACGSRMIHQEIVSTISGDSAP